jgi:RNA polymerase sigma-70 factor (ECF subfamily)
MEQEIRSRLARKQYHEAFELLLPAYQDKVFRLTCAMLGNEAEAEETAQEIFIRIWKALGGYRGQASLSTWIYSIARNTCLTALRRQAAERSMIVHDPDLESRQVSARERNSAIDLDRLLAGLPENYRQVVALYYMEDKSYEEAARQLDLPMGTVKTYLHRARKLLAAEIERTKLAEGVRSNALQRV